MNIIKYQGERLEMLANDIEGIVEVADHQVAEIGIRLMYEVGSLVLEAAEELKQEPVEVLTTVAKMVKIARKNRWLRYALQTAQKFEEDELPNKGVRQFIREDLTEIKKVETPPKCTKCLIHCPITLVKTITLVK